MRCSHAMVCGPTLKRPASDGGVEVMASRCRSDLPGGWRGRSRLLPRMLRLRSQYHPERVSVHFLLYHFLIQYHLSCFFFFWGIVLDFLFHFILSNTSSTFNPALSVSLLHEFSHLVLYLHLCLFPDTGCIYHSF